jgi:hypothetical protein
MEKGHVSNLISRLNKLQIKYVFTGAFALAYYGFPRASADVDIIIERNKSKLLKLVKALQISNYDVSENDVSNAVEKCEHFAVFHKRRMFPYFDFKVACTRDELNAISDRKIVSFHGVKCRIVSAEDLVVKKLEWGDLKDVEAILVRYGDKLDMKKLSTMAKTKNVDEKLQNMIRVADKERRT